MTGPELAQAAGYRCVLDGPAVDPNAALRPTQRAGKDVLNWHRDARGGLVELWRRSWEAGPRPLWDYGGVAQAYISETRPGVIKGWHLHPKGSGDLNMLNMVEEAKRASAQIDRFVCIRGTVLVATFDLAAYFLLDVAPEERHLYVGERQVPVVERVLCAGSLERIDIPPNTAHGWFNIGTEDAWVLNLTSAEYSGALEYRRAADAGPAPGVPYDWRRSRDG